MGSAEGRSAEGRRCPSALARWAHLPPAAWGLLASVGQIGGCGTGVSGVQARAWPQVIVAEIEPGAQILDARGADAWWSGHIPGAAVIDIDLLDATLAEDGETPGPERLAAALGAAGIRRDAPVTLYGSGAEGWGDDGAAYWTLRYLGHDAVTVLDGGFLAWISAGGTPTRDRDAPSPQRFTVALQPDLLARTEDVAALEGPLLDVRSPAEFSAGHIPGALSWPWDDALRPEGTLRDPEALERDLAELGLDGSAPITVYCERGIRAGHGFLVLEALGWSGSRSYIGSMTRWLDSGGSVER